ncbi:hypothetical protein GHT09_000714 [Marmota monax]|uniref:Uncharacterized protein n=1 Tax=Marmota monax TaxID=9995 RepID=A0A834QYH1_MARMO|nr:hypothetical protein GHT09_000714 [Marmota monax]
MLSQNDQPGAKQLGLFVGNQKDFLKEEEEEEEEQQQQQQQPKASVCPLLF